MDALDPAATLLDAIAADDEPLAAAPAAAPQDPVLHAQRFVVFTVAGAHYAVPETFVTELERVPRVTMVPRVPVWIRGVANLRGDVLSVIDLRMFLGLEPTSPHSGRMLVVRLLDEEFSTGLLVDAVGQIVRVPADSVRPPASPLEGPLAAYLTGVCVIGERLVAALDLDRLLRSPDIRQFDEPKDTN